MAAMEHKRTPRGTALWTAWAAVTAAGWAAAGAAMALTGADRGAAQYLFIPLSAVGQWLLLRRHFARASAWLVATIGGAAAAALSYAALLALPGSLLGPAESGLRHGISTLIDGVAIGTAQWLVLRNNVRGSARWILATAAPLWLVAFQQLDRGMDTPNMAEVVDTAGRVGLYAGSLGMVGLLIGAFTGGVLAWMVDAPRVWEDDRAD